MFLYVSGAKGWKTDEKQAKFAQLAVSVPELSEIDRISPWKFILEEMTT